MTAVTNRRTLAAGLTLATALAVTGCQSSEQTAAESPAAPKAGKTVDGKDLGAKIAAASRAAKSVRATATVAGRSADSVVADLALISAKRTDAQVQLPGRGGDAPLQVRLVAGTGYVKNPQAGGPQWVSVAPTARNPVARSALRVAEQVLTQGPTGQADLLARSSVSVVGTERLGATATTRYRVAIPASRVLDQIQTSVQPLSQGDPEGERMLKTLRSMLQGVTLTQDIWVDQQHRPQRVSITLPKILGEGGGGTTSAAAITVSFSQWGKPVNIAAPPTAQTKSVDEVWGDRTPTATRRGRA